MAYVSVKTLRRAIQLLLLLLTPGLLQSAQGEEALPDVATVQSWIEAMKTAPRGPFARIRWFCNDGSVLPPKAYACSKRGGGVQHGEWNDRAKKLRANGYYIGNVLASLDTEKIIKAPGASELLNQILIEQFLIDIDDGWIMRKARYYRGAFQAEDEQRVARELLLGMVKQPAWIDRGYLPLRIAVELLDHGVETSSVSDVRQQALTLSQKDKGFLNLRIKIHNKPDKGDAELVRDYASKVKDPKLVAEYTELAKKIDEIYTSASVVENLEVLHAKLSYLPDLAKALRDGAVTLASTQDPVQRYLVSSTLMARLRENFAKIRSPEVRLAALEMNLALETDNYTTATQMREQLPTATRRKRLGWMEAVVDAIYGAGFISNRERQALYAAFKKLQADNLPLKTYKAELSYLARAMGWSRQWLLFHFSASEAKLYGIEPLTALFTQGVLRGSALYFYSLVGDSLARDANRLAGVKHKLFDDPAGSGVRALNPGIAKGTLYLSVGKDLEDLDPKGIYLIPETTADLSPVAGILTTGEGNPLSHVQLLARNLGIPNVAISPLVTDQLKKHDGSKVILAVSPAGTVQLSTDKGQLDDLFAKDDQAQETLIQPDLKKLDLNQQDFIPLSQLRATDSGHTVGPKAANLGELRHHYPEAVSDGLAIPFGIFRQLLDQPMQGTNQTIFEWMVAQYRELEKTQADSPTREQATQAFRAKLEKQILNADPGEKFRKRLRTAMKEAFGQEGSYGVFVRSDTNVEDLSGFTGAGLNLTVANVVGFEKVSKVISEVWASPFTQRAFAWRQAHMAQPEHVYTSVLLLLTINSDKSGVMVTQDVDTGASGWLSIVTSEGVGGGVEGEAAESLRVSMKDGGVRLLAQATAPTRTVAKAGGGVEKLPVSGDDSVLKPDEIKQLVTLARELPKRFPLIKDADGNPSPADVEFGFVDGKLRLFQIRPFLESRQARGSEYLRSLDQGIDKKLNKVVVPMDTVPEDQSA